MQPRAALSDRGLAEAHPDDGMFLGLRLHDERARTPAEVFVDHPDDVIALALDDAEVANVRV
ncbi:hypothetical protein [Dyella sp. Tek66A03]|uniref:hypothetical protein n=1 Tax=Dyella sp. Tek66A03 TaxID=3458298 RepID=UPI00403E3C72